MVGLTTAKAIALAPRQAAARRQPSRRPCADRAAAAALSTFPICCCWFPAAIRQFLIGRGRRALRALGTTIDDALGEAFDKTAKLLGLGYPGGPQVEALGAARRSASGFGFPRPLKGRSGLRFLLLRPEDRGARSGRRISAIADAQDVADICASLRGGGGRDPGGPARDMAVARCSRSIIRSRRSRRWSWPAASPPIRRCRQPCEDAAMRARLRLHRAAAAALHRQCRDDRLGRGRAAGARPHRSAGRRRPRRAGRWTRRRRPLIGSGKLGAKA